MITLTKKGLYCAVGNFYIDPSGAVENAIVTHAHSDHARRGAATYYSTRSGADLVKSRLGRSINIKSYEFSEVFYLGDVKISLHPAGHILGSAQVRLEYGGEVWVASGDYKREDDPTCEPFEVVECDVFITEATFGTPGYKWEKDRDLAREILNWWEENKIAGRNSVLFAYSLGKTQRILGILEPHLKKPVYCHAAAADLNDCYRRQGVKLAETICLSELEDESRLSGELVIAPQAFLKSPKVSILNENYQTAFASGWMAKKGGYGSDGYDKGFLMSDHADWNDLLLTIEQSKAKRVYVQHRGHGALVRHLRKMGLQAFPDFELIAKNPNQLSFF